jgi:hypothetical protein
MSVRDLSTCFGDYMLKKMCPHGFGKYLVGGTMQQPLFQWPQPCCTNGEATASQRQRESGTEG